MRSREDCQPFLTFIVDNPARLRRSGDKYDDYRRLTFVGMCQQSNAKA
ncbi:MAG: hypothetical protein GKS00_24670 [Alphaproteobacteria bacterium]|nr:hypothetical protein [Alphaproteobacteria bacterium]